MRRPHALTVGLAATLTVTGAHGQPETPDGGPLIVGTRRESWNNFELESFGAVLDLFGENRVERLKQPDGSTFTDRSDRLRETLDLFGQASIGHKNLLHLTGTVQIGLEERDIRSESTGLFTRESDIVNLYDVSARILGNGPVPLTIYSRRQQSTLDRAFAGTIDDTLTETGAIAEFRSETAPTTIQYFHREHEQNDALGRGTTTVVQDTLTAQSGIRLADGQRLDINYTFDRIEETQADSFADSYDRHDANIIHTLDFGGETRPHQLRSSLRLYDQSGSFSQQNLRLDELLLLRHTDRLETRYNVTVDQQQRGGQEQRLYRGEASIRHHLFDSLTSTASIGAQRLEAPEDFGSDELFVSGGLDYTKLVPKGRFDASAGASYNSQHNSARGGTISVFNEPHLFNDPFPIVLSRRNIVPGSIVVTPIGGFPSFVEGFDYTVRIFPDRAELRIPPGSAIEDGQTVLASYDIGPEPESDIDTTGTSFAFRYSLTEGALTGLGVYTNYRTLDQSINTANPGLFVLDDVRTLVVGVEYVRAGFDVSLEHESRDSTVDPFEANRLQALYQQALGRDSAVSLQYTHEEIDYSIQSNRVTFDRLTARWNQRFDDDLDVNARLEYRNERNELSGNSEGFDQILGFTWHRGQTTVYGSVRNGFLNGEGADSTSQRFQIGIRRAF